jgi:hypothetical protein
MKSNFFSISKLKNFLDCNVQYKLFRFIFYTKKTQIFQLYLKIQGAMYISIFINDDHYQLTGL